MGKIVIASMILCASVAGGYVGGAYVGLWPDHFSIFPYSHMIDCDNGYTVEQIDLERMRRSAPEAPSS